MDIEYLDATNPSLGERLGRDVTTRLILKSFENLNFENDVIDNVNAILAADQELYQGIHVDELTSVFTKRGFLSDNKVEGSISSNTTWSGLKILTDNVTVNSGVTLTIAQGTKIISENGSSLIVNGTIHIQGNSSNKVTFDFVSPNSTVENGIIVNQGASASIDYAEIKNAYNGIYIDEELVDINGCEIHDCYNGLHFYRTNYTSGGECEIGGNKIYNNDFAGILGYYSGGYIVGNEIYGNSIGVALSDYSSPLFGEPLMRGYNNIHNNETGIHAMNNSNPNLGDSYSSGYNSIASSGYYAVKATYNSNVSAMQNYWGTSSPSSSLFYIYLNSSVDYSSWLTYSPTQQQMEVSNKEEEIVRLQKRDDSKDLYKRLSKARHNIYLEKFREAELVCEDIIDTYPDVPEASFALDLLWQSSRKKKDKTTESKFKKYADKKGKKKINGLARLIEAVGSKNNRIDLLDEILNDFRDNEDVIKSTLFAKFLSYINESKDYEKAGKVGNTIIRKYPNTELSKRVNIHLKGKEGLKYENQQNIMNKTNKEDEFLVNAYPNPFNPTTTIKFKLPSSQRVKIKVFNILGQQVRELTNQVYSSGTHKILFNAVNLASGIYYYTIETNAKRFIRKMMLVK